MRRTLLTLGALVFASLAVFAAGGIPKVAKGPQETSGPLGFPALKKLTESLGLTHDQEQAVLRIYNEYHKKEHEALQEASKKDSSGKAAGMTDTKALRGDMASEIKAILSEEQRKKLDGLLSESGKKK